MPVDEINVKPIIRELVRTELCFPDLQLLVDRICIVRLPPLDGSTGSQAAYSLYLTDRERSIQAVIKSSLHRRIVRGEIKEGSIVVLKDYELTESKRLNGEGNVSHLKIADFYPIGEEDRPSQPFEVVGDQKKEPTKTDALTTPLPTGDLLNEEAVASRLETGFSEGDTAPELDGDPLSHTEPLTKVNEDTTSEPDSEFTPLGKRQLFQKRPAQTALDLLNLTPRKRRREEIIDSDFTVPENQPQQQQIHHSPDPKSSSPPSAIASTLSTLASVTFPHASKNQTHNFLALITSVSTSTTKPPNMPRKRDCRIMDTSTEKQVLLSVFTDPVGFQPKVGTIALFRGLVTHDWDGGNLKAWPWVCEGREWCVVVDDGEGEGAREEVEEGNLEGLRRLRERILGVSEG